MPANALIVKGRSMNCPYLKCSCGAAMRLPYPTSPQTVLSRSKWSPKAILSREVVCLECGQVSSFTTKDIRWDQDRQGPSAADDNIICWCLETGCEEELCDLPVEFHLLTSVQKGTEEVRFLMLRLFERGFFQGLSCGRGHRPAKTRIRAIRRVA